MAPSKSSSTAAINDRKPRGEITPEARAAIIAAVKAGERKSVIAARFRISPAAIDRTLQRFEKTGRLVSRPRSGRPKSKNKGRRAGGSTSGASPSQSAEPCSEQEPATQTPVMQFHGPVRNFGAVSSSSSSSAESSLSGLLATLTATLHPTTFVFTSLSPVSPLPPLSETQLLFREPDGVTVIVSIDFAIAQKMQYFFPCRMITLNVTTSLDAVGFMAIVSSRLAARNMGVNPVSGFYHDHLFVPLGRENEALEVLAAVSDEHKQDGQAGQ
ncbi:hypothetical protein L249_5182 [Ophiocordyceps polyrhachis-furcata BCC 54312]|uniref:DUF2241 domain-containing protein n=1 Tax=Ophiocordyceps polyrhachis-furcata BCC 54312 TaxID=1330021 RepID=A0A367L9D2_9HYPO|nr:hypothetical protein L249_5182 [Ophiocordyceps polyrhachis-furcata BCC 54312]